MRARGFTLIETLIAAVLLATGLLAVASTARASYRLAALGGALSRSAQIAEARAGRLQAAGCHAASGSASHGPFQERWTIRSLPGLREAALEVDFRLEGRTRRFTLSWAQLCAAELM